MNASNNPPPYYSCNDILSYNELFNWVDGMRGRGKTFDCLRYGAKRFKKTNGKIALVRRFPDEAKELKYKLGNDIRKVLNLDICCGDNYKLKVDGKDAGDLICLTKSIEQKSVPRDDYDSIIIDETIIDNPSKHYIGGYKEPEIVLGLFESVFRPRAGNDKGRLILLSNCVTFANPYFLYFDVEPWCGRFYHKPSRSIICEHDFNEAFAEGKRNTRFGKLIKGTNYERYSINADYIRDNNAFILKKTGKCTPDFSITYAGSVLQFWYNWQDGLYYTERGEALKDNYSLTRDDMGVNTKLIQNVRYSPIRKAVDAFRHGMLYFADGISKSIGMKMLSFFLK